MLETLLVDEGINSVPLQGRDKHLKPRRCSRASGFSRNSNINNLGVTGSCSVEGFRLEGLGSRNLTGLKVKCWNPLGAVSAVDANHLPLASPVVGL